MLRTTVKNIAFCFHLLKALHLPLQTVTDLNTSIRVPCDPSLLLPHCHRRNFPFVRQRGPLWQENPVEKHVSGNYSADSLVEEQICHTSPGSLNSANHKAGRTFDTVDISHNCKHLKEKELSFAKVILWFSLLLNN